MPNIDFKLHIAICVNICTDYLRIVNLDKSNIKYSNYTYIYVTT